MKTLKIIAVLILINSNPLRADATSLKWMEMLQNESHINICGDSSIQNTRASMKKHFFLGSPKRGYVFTGLLAHDKYWKILKENNLEEARLKIKKAFAKTSLWEIELDSTTRFLGNPTSIETMFTATVKDCVEGAEKTIGGNCASQAPEHKVACCSEKFSGPVITWKYKEREYKLNYSPDPSVSLVMSNPQDVRYCHVTDNFKL